MEKPVTTILLIEDDPIHAKLIRRELHNFDESIIVEHVQSAEEGFGCLEKAPVYDLIVINYDLPRKNGLEAFRIIKTVHNFKKPVIMLLSQKYEAKAVDILKEGVTNCLIKTEEYTTILPHLIHDCLERRPHEQQERVILEYRPQEELLRFTIDGQPVVGRKDETVLDVAKRYGIYIPTLCYHPSVSRLGACRICLVEITVGKMTRLHPSCMFPIQEGIVVKTSTENVKNVRKMILELLMARCPDAEVIRDMAISLGIEKTRFSIRLEADKCILCGLCVRVCDEVIGANAIGFSHRGIHRKIGTPFMELTDACTGCAECAKVCPTQAITLDHIDQKVRKKRLARVAVKCDSCAGYNNRACVNNCPTGALKDMTIKEFLDKNKGSINVELRDLLKYSLEEANAEGKNV
ncbi:MAG: 2Fe-2S iron-sulfur cluster-binding protein [bacterium]